MRYTLAARITKKRILVLVLAGAIPLLAWWNHVPSEPNETDVKFIRLMLSESGKEGLLRARAATFADEVSIVQAVQHAILSHAPVDVGLPINQPREPETLYHQRKGLCYDRSRTIEKTLAIMGFDVRHVSVYSTATTGSALKSLLTPGNLSHAVSEVRTSRGWLVIDPNLRWISLTQDGMPLSIEDLAVAAEAGEMPTWTDTNRSQIYVELSRPFTYVIGLYSRHGGFYPPYTPVPDINYGQFIGNFTRFWTTRRTIAPNEDPANKLPS